MPQSFETLVKNITFRKLSIKMDKSATVLSFSGALGIDDLAKLDKYLAAFFKRSGSARQIEFKLDGLDYLDSDGAYVLYKYQRQAEKQGVTLEFTGLSAEHQRIYQLLDPEKLSKKPLVSDQRKAGFFVSLGISTYGVMQESYQIIGYFGRIIALGLRMLVKPRSLRWKDMFQQMNLVGVGGLPIVGMIGLLLGMILAFMSIMQLEPFGASIYVATLVSVAMVKELGPIMTAIVVAGRSGSAFAAEIGSMKENEELDALTVMGYDPVMFLTMPRVVATVLVVPILFIFSCFFGVFGGLLVGTTGMGLEINTYIQYSGSALSVSDFVISTIKSMVFAFLIAGVGCQRGFAVRGGSSAVGKATTSSVVISIFIIIVVDSIFAIVGQYAWWW